MKNNSLVSVIIPFYNSEQFLRDAVDSVIEQTYENWELLLIDDGSTDSSTAFAREYADKYSDKIFYLEHKNHENKGACASRNLGILHCKGKYIALLDSDDVWLAEKLHEQVEIFKNNKKIDAVIGLSEYWQSWDTSSKQSNEDNIPELGLKADMTYKPKSLLNQMYPLGNASAPCPSVVMLTKKIIEKIGGFEEDFTGIYQFYEDQAFLSKLYYNAFIYASEKCWIKYRIHPDSCSSRVKELGEHHRVRLRYFYWLMRYFYNNGLKDKKTLELLDKNILETESKTENSAGKWEKIAKDRKNEIDKLKKQVAALKKGSGKNNKNKTVVRDKKLSNLPIKKFSSEGAKMLSNYVSPSLNYLAKTVKENINSMYDLEDKPFAKKRLTKPVSRQWGWDRGTPIDRYYIEKFLKQNSKHIKGKVLEVNDDNYTKKFGGKRVTRSDVLDIDENNKNATIISDLQIADNIPSDEFDCIILTQTLQLTYDFDAVVKSCERILNKGGVMLVTFPGITKILVNKPFKWYWSFTSFSAEEIFYKHFDKEKVEISKYGNVLSASSFLYGLSAEEMSSQELDYIDPQFEALICVNAGK